MRALVLVLLAVSHLEAYRHPFLKDECIVKSDGVEIITFNDSVAFYLAALSKDKDVRLEIRQDSELFASWKIDYSLSWMSVRLDLGSQPQLLVDSKTIPISENITLVSGAPKFITIKNANVLEGCPEGLPTRILNNTTENIEVPMSRDEDMLILIPTRDTKVTIEVNGIKQVMCWDTKTQKPVVLPACEDKQHLPLMKDTPIRLRVTYGTEQVTLKVWGDDVNLASERTLQIDTTRTRLKFTTAGVEGLVSIVQCLKDFCTAGTEASYPAGFTTEGSGDSVPAGTKESSKDGDEDGGDLTWVLLKVIPGVLLVVLIQFFLVVYLYCQLRRERRRSYQQHRESSDTGFQQEKGLTSAEVGVASEGTGVVDTWNDLYVSSDELGLRVNCTHPNTHEQQV